LQVYAFGDVQSSARANKGISSCGLLAGCARSSAAMTDLLGRTGDCIELIQLPLMTGRNDSVFIMDDPLASAKSVRTIANSAHVNGLIPVKPTSAPISWIM
jgi:hypothetical protein